MRAGCRLRRASAVLDARFHLKASSISSAVQRLETPKRWRLVRRQSDGQALRRERRFARCPALTGGAADRWAGVGAGGGAWLASRVPPARAAARWPRTWLASKRAPEAGLHGRLPRAFDKSSSARAGEPRPAPSPRAAMPSTTRFLGSPSTRPPRRRDTRVPGTNTGSALPEGGLASSRPRPRRERRSGPFTSAGGDAAWRRGLAPRAGGGLP